MTSSCTVHLLHQAEHDLVLLENLFFRPKFCAFYDEKHLGFHPQTSILQSKPKKLHKKRIKGRIKISPNSWNPIKWAPKTIKKWVLLQTIFSTSLQHQSGLKTENQKQKKKKIQKMASKLENGKPKITQICSSNVIHV